MKASKGKAAPASAQKKQSAMRLERPQWQMEASTHLLIGFRAFDGNEEHYPVISLVMPEEEMCRRWAAELIQSGQHPDCGFKIEKLAMDLATYHIMSQVGDLPDDPLVGSIDSLEPKPYDLGPLSSQMTLEEMERMKGLPAAALEAAKLALKQRLPISENKPEATKNGKPAGKKSHDQPEAKPATAAPGVPPSGNFSPAPKPGPSGKTAQAGGGAKAALPKRSHLHPLRARPAAKPAKRA